MRCRRNECATWTVVLGVGVAAVIAGVVAGAAAGGIAGAEAGAVAAEHGLSEALRRQEIHNALHQNDPLKGAYAEHLFEDAEIVCPR